jgi:hypothetical protein
VNVPEGLAVFALPELRHAGPIASLDAVVAGPA